MTQKRLTCLKGRKGRTSWNSKKNKRLRVNRRAAVRAALSGETAKMVGIQRVPGDAYAIETNLIDVERVRLIERCLPDAFINEAGNGVTPAFKEWAAPLVGELPSFVSFL